MKHACLVVAFALLQVGCEVPRSDHTDSELRTPAPAASMPATKAVQVSDKPVQSEVDRRDHRSVLVRTSNPVATQLMPVLSYSAPAPELLLPADVIAVVPREPQVPDRVAARRPLVQGPLALDAAIASLEVALLADGIDVVDRQLLPQLEFEHFFQHAQASDAEVDRMSRFSDGGSAELTFASPLVGRGVMKARGASWWGRSGSGARPLLNGGDPKATAALQTGRFVSARLLLQVDGIRYQTNLLRLRSDAPAAASIPQVPLVEKRVDAMPAYAEQWRADPADSFHYEGRAECVFFDATRQQLWSFQHAWVGAKVSRADYMKLASTREVHRCERCSHETTETKPGPGDNPELWKCPTCGQVHDVVYLLGHKSAEHEAWDDQVAIHVVFVAPRPGVYPVRSMTSTAGDLATGLCLQEGPRGVESLQALVSQRLLGASTDAVCWVRDDLSALVVPVHEIERMREELRESQWPLPKVDGDGRQQFAPAIDVLVEKVAELPVERGELSLRLVDVETGRLLLSGLLASDYLAAMAGEREVAFGPEGLRSGCWTARESQRDVIERDLAVRVAKLLRQ